jgi:hypothetical protein
MCAFRHHEDEKMKDLDAKTYAKKKKNSSGH